MTRAYGIFKSGMTISHLITNVETSASGKTGTVQIRIMYLRSVLVSVVLSCENRVGNTPLRGSCSWGQSYMSALGLANEEAALEFIRPTVREVGGSCQINLGVNPQQNSVAS